MLIVVDFCRVEVEAEGEGRLGCIGQLLGLASLVHRRLGQSPGRAGALLVVRWWVGGGGAL